MEAFKLRTELLREISPLLDNELAMEKILTFVRTLLPPKKVEIPKKDNSATSVSVSPELEKWGGCVSFSEEEIEKDPRLKHILSK